MRGRHSLLLAGLALGACFEIPAAPPCGLDEPCDDGLICRDGICERGSAPALDPN